MVPTFASFTNRHPRAVTVFGVALFTIGITLWAETVLFTQKGTHAPVVVGDVVEEKMPVAIDEKIVILKSLESTEPDLQSVEEKSAVLESLQSGDEAVVALEEQTLILERLQTENSASTYGNDTAP